MQETTKSVSNEDLPGSQQHKGSANNFLRQYFSFAKTGSETPSYLNYATFYPAQKKNDKNLIINDDTSPEEDQSACCMIL